MKPIRSVWGGAVLTTALIVGLAFAASLIPQSNATEQSQENSPKIEAQPVAAEGLNVEIRDVKSGDGELLVVVFDNRQAYDNYDFNGAAGFAEVAADSMTVNVPFASLRDGPYAVFAYHDENGDDDLNMDGDYPLEGYGTSGARNWWHEPTFDEAASDARNIRVKMFYLD